MIPEPKSIPFHLSKVLDNNFKRESNSVIKPNELYATVAQIKPLSKNFGVNFLTVSTGLS